MKRNTKMDFAISLVIMELDTDAYVSRNHPKVQEYLKEYNLKELKDMVDNHVPRWIAPALHWELIKGTPREQMVCECEFCGKEIGRYSTRYMIKKKNGAVNYVRNMCNECITDIKPNLERALRV